MEPKFRSLVLAVARPPVSASGLAENGLKLRRQYALSMLTKKINRPCVILDDGESHINALWTLLLSRALGLYRCCLANIYRTIFHNRINTSGRPGRSDYQQKVNQTNPARNFNLLPLNSQFYLFLRRSNCTGRYVWLLFICLFQNSASISIFLAHTPHSFDNSSSHWHQEVMLEVATH